jgi:hypothetical protein
VVRALDGGRPLAMVRPERDGTLAMVF